MLTSQAIGYLYQKPQLRTDAMHFAIALEYYGLLKVSHPEDPIGESLVDQLSDGAKA